MLRARGKVNASCGRLARECVVDPRASYASLLPWRKERLRQENEGRREIERAGHERELVEHERDRLREERDRLENELEAVRISASVRCYRMSVWAPAVPVPRSKASSRLPTSTTFIALTTWLPGAVRTASEASPS